MVVVKIQLQRRLQYMHYQFLSIQLQEVEAHVMEDQEYQLD